MRLSQQYFSHITYRTYLLIFAIEYLFNLNKLSKETTDLFFFVFFCFLFFVFFGGVVSFFRRGSLRSSCLTISNAKRISIIAHQHLVDGIE